MATIKCTSHPEFNGQVGPVRFADGEGHTELPAMLAHFKRDDRFTVEGDSDGDSDGDKPRAGSKAALQAEAERLGLDASGTKGELAARIKAQQDAAEDNPHDPEPRDGDGDGNVHDGTPDEHPVDESPEGDTEDDTDQE